MCEECVVPQMFRGGKVELNSSSSSISSQAVQLAASSKKSVSTSGICASASISMQSVDDPNTCACTRVLWQQ